MSTEDPRWGPPPQGYPPQGGQYPPAEGYYGQQQQDQYGGQYGQPQQGQYGQPQYGQYGQYGQQGGQYGQYRQPQAQAPYNPQYAQPYTQPAMRQRATVKNPYATRSLVYGILSMVALIIILFTPIAIVGLWSFYAVYYSIKGINYSTKLPGHKGIVTAIIGLLLSVFSVVGFIGILALSAMS